ncbi:MAG: hypothetical protein L3K19_02630, partial [Thermoplasmata archaeon]|nr:hypothetical protein [Thermoplasmata archaeon]
ANETPTSLRLLTPLSYKEVFSPGTRTEHLVHDSLYNAPTPTTNPVTLTMKGYSVALLREKLSPGVAPPHLNPPNPTVSPHAPARVAHLAAPHHFQAPPIRTLPILRKASAFAPWWIPPPLGTVPGNPNPLHGPQSTISASGPATVMATALTPRRFAAAA